MAFRDQAKEDLRTILIDLGEWSEDITYLAVGPEGAQAPKTIKALIEEGDIENPLEVGFAGRGGPSPIRVVILKDETLGMASVAEKFDHIRRFPGTPEEREYEVTAILDKDDPAGWRLYATP